MFYRIAEFATAAALLGPLLAAWLRLAGLL